LRWFEASILCHAFPRLELSVKALAFALQLIVGSTELGDSLLSQELLEGPFLDILLFVLLEL
jgi:hypothetical protein